MARYDGQYGGPRGGWRGGQGFPPFPEQAPPGYGGTGGQWNRGVSPSAGHGDGRGYGGDYGAGGYGQRGGFGPGQGGWNAVGPYGGAPRMPGAPMGGGGPRGEYGGAYEEYGGWPGGPRRGTSYGGGPMPGRGYDAGYGGGQGGFARAPFMPEEAYRRHPEYGQPRQPREWEAHQSEFGGEEPGDDQVRDAVYRRMSADAWLDPQRITVEVEDGVVTLTGEVDDFLKARYAWDDAWEAEGVRGVVNNLTVRADQPQTPTHGDVVPQSASGGTTADEAGAS